MIIKLAQHGSRKNKKASHVPAGTYIMPSWTEEDNQKIRDDAAARFRDPAIRNDAKESLRGLGNNELKKRYQEKFIPPPPKAKRKSDKERAQEQQEYAEFYQNYVDIRSGKKAPPKQSTSPWKAVKDQLPIKELKAHIEKQANHNEALQGLVNVSKALSGSIGKWGDRWEERREEHQLNELIPQVPDYLSKIPDEGIYFSRFTFEELVVKQQKLMTELNLLFGVVAFVGAFFTAGGSLYLLAAVNGVWGVAQIGVSTMKLRDLNDGEVSDTSFFGINQEMLDVTGLMLGAVDLAILGKTLLKGGKRVANAKNMNAVQELAQQKPPIKGAGDSPKTPRTGPEWDEYFRSKYGDENVDWKTSSEYKLYGDKYIPYTPKIRPNAIITKPSLPKGGKPEGNYAKIPPKGDRGLERQNEAADVLSEQGYRTVMLDELPNGNAFDGNGYGINPDKSPDFIIEGQVFDCYAPDSTNLSNILKMLRDKTTNQARRIVLNLNDYPIEKRAELIEFLLSQAHKDLKHLNELLVIEGRQVTRAYWRYE
ncbi:hypothetical protein NYE54_27305 [Paenibacillus sp. FSL K6-1330]|uniref:CdiA C-terminal domain-containing protein n=1 Tax=Paenibacillus sp. FSL K6-1330 TaxID=2975292 RepID=UPI0030D6D53D